MDTLKAGSYPDTPETLEKGRLEPLHSEPPHACSAQAGQSRRRRPLVKHWIIVGAVALTWFLFSSRRRNTAAFSPPNHHWEDDEVGYTEEHAPQCVTSTNWTSYYDQPSWNPDYPLGAETTFSLPLDSDALYLTSRGPFQNGLVVIEQSSNVADSVDVRVRVAYHDGKELEHAAVCQVERAEKERGVGIFTSPLKHHPPHRTLKGSLRFDVTLTLPAGEDGPLFVKKLVTRLPNYSQNVTDLQKSVFFDRISLSSANGLLNVQSAAFDAGQFSLLNGEIDGHFSAQSSLDLHNLNGGIRGAVNLRHRESGGPPKLTVRSVNGRIHANVSLTSEASSGGEFEVNAELKNGDVGLTFIDTPVNSVLRSHVETISGRAEVSLDGAFEGTYSLQSLFGKKHVSQQTVEDPAGRERKRVVSVDEGHGRVDGEIRWVESDGSSSENEGYVILKALAASLKLFV